MSKSLKKMEKKVSSGWYLTKDFKTPCLVYYTKGNDVELSFLKTLKQNFLARCNEEGYREAAEIIENIIEKLR